MAGKTKDMSKIKQLFSDFFKSKAKILHVWSAF